MHDPLKTKICDMFGIEFPILAFSHCKDVVAAVTNAGGLGVLGELAHAPEQIAQDIAWLRERVGDKPFGVDLIFPASLPEKAPSLEERRQVITQEHRDFLQRFMEQHHLPEPASTRGADAAVPIGMSSLDDARRQLDVLLEERVPLIAAGLGSPAFVLDAAHARGIKVAGLVGRTRLARREIEAGVDIIIAQGYDGGGHTGEIGTFTLVPQVVAIAGDT
ncbi:MAG: nitronate monooxygenase, partial [Dehalococcoidia bacterium]